MTNGIKQDSNARGAFIVDFLRTCRVLLYALRCDTYCKRRCRKTDAYIRIFSQRSSSGSLTVREVIFRVRMVLLKLQTTLCKGYSVTGNES